MAMQTSEFLVPGLFEEKPTQHPMLRRLGRFVGTWVGSGDYFDGVQIYRDRKAVHTYEWTCAGHVLMWKILSHGPLKFYQSHAAITWNERATEYEASYYDNFGTMDVFTARWLDEERFEMNFRTGFAFLGPEVKQLSNLVICDGDDKQRWQLRANRGASWETIISQDAYRLF